MWEEQKKMAISKAQLKDAIREAMFDEFAYVPTNESDIDHQFSDGFESKMNRLINRQKSNLWRLTNTATKRVAVAVVVFMMLMATACSVPAVRKPIVEFFVEVYETFVGYFFEGDTSKTITGNYYISEIPDGFAETERFTDSNLIQITYSDTNENLIIFSQSVTNGTDLTVDNEQGNTEKIKIENRDVFLYVSENDYAHAMWLEENYLIEISFVGMAEKDFIINVISTVKIE